MKELFIALVLAVVGESVPIAEYDGEWFRLFNPGPDAYYCIVELHDGRGWGSMLYPKQYSNWFHTEAIAFWECR